MPDQNDAGPVDVWRVSRKPVAVHDPIELYPHKTADTPLGTIAATWWKRCPGCGHTIPEKSLITMRPIDDRPEWVCQTCGAISA